MFKDLKEYQEITQLYHNSVNISEEQRVINTAISEAEFTAEEIQYLDENFDELWENELATLTEEIISDCLVEENLTEEQLQEVVKKLAPKAAKAGVKAASGLPAMIKKGISAVKKRIPQGVKDTVSGGVSVAKSAMKKVGGVVKKVAPKVLKALPKVALPAAAIGGVVAGVNKLRNKGKKDRETKDAELQKKIDKGIKDSGMGDKGTAITQKGRDQAMFNRGERKARKDLNDPTLNLTKSEIEAKKKTDTETKPLTKKQKFDAKFIKKDKGVGFVKRGTPGAQRAENKEKAKNRAKEMAKARLAKKAEMAKEEYTPYDIVLEYLLSTEQAATIEEANYVMTEMDAETIQGIVEEKKKTLDEMDMMKMPVVNVLGGIAGAVGGTVAAAKYLGRKAGERGIKKEGEKSGKPGLIKTIKDRTDATNKAIEQM